MLWKICTYSLILFAASFVHAEQNYVPDVTQEKFEATDGVLDHLIPVSATNKDIYYLAEFTSYESFQNSWAWRIYKDDDNSTYKIRSWEIHETQDRKSTVEKKIIEREVTRNLAQAIYKIWANSVLDSRYTLVISKGLDGASYNFSTYLRSVGWISAETWSPSKELPPLWLLEIGRTIYKESRESNSEPLGETSKIKELSSKLSSYSSPRSSL